jgi:hypothetical protein
LGALLGGVDVYCSYYGHSGAKICENWLTENAEKSLWKLLIVATNL